MVHNCRGTKCGPYICVPPRTNYYFPVLHDLCMGQPVLYSIKMSTNILKHYKHIL